MMVVALVFFVLVIGFISVIVVDLYRDRKKEKERQTNIHIKLLPEGQQFNFESVKVLNIEEGTDLNGKKTDIITILTNSGDIFELSNAKILKPIYKQFHEIKSKNINKKMLVDFMVFIKIYDEKQRYTPSKKYSKHVVGEIIDIV